MAVSFIQTGIEGMQKMKRKLSQTMKKAENVIRPMPAINCIYVCTITILKYLSLNNILKHTQVLCDVSSGCDDLVLDIRLLLAICLLLQALEWEWEWIQWLV